MIRHKLYIELHFLNHRHELIIIHSSSCTEGIFNSDLEERVIGLSSHGLIAWRSCCPVGIPRYCLVESSSTQGSIVCTHICSLLLKHFLSNLIRNTLLLLLLSEFNSIVFSLSLESIMVLAPRGIEGFLHAFFSDILRLGMSARLFGGLRRFPKREHFLSG
jgi:hypothetical protein